MINQQNLTSNPLYLRAQEMAKGKNENELREIALNICREKGIDFNNAFQQFQLQFKGFNL